MRYRSAIRELQRVRPIISRKYADHQLVLDVHDITEQIPAFRVNDKLVPYGRISDDTAAAGGHEKGGRKTQRLEAIVCGMRDAHRCAVNDRVETLLWYWQTNDYYLCGWRKTNFTVYRTHFQYHEAHLM